jgi:hypothetical protein
MIFLTPRCQPFFMRAWKCSAERKTGRWDFGFRLAKKAENLLQFLVSSAKKASKQSFGPLF